MRIAERLGCIALLACALAAGARADEVVLHTERSLYRQIVVYEDDGQRCMRFTRQTTARQSCITPRDPEHIVFDYLRMMLGALYVKPDPRRVLVVGLGGGTLVD